MQGGLASAVFRPLIGPDGLIPPAYLTPVGDLAGVNALDFLYAQSCDRVAAVDEKDEGFPADGGQVEGHTQRFRLRQLAEGAAAKIRSVSRRIRRS